MEKVCVGLIGFGTVGMGVARILLHSKDTLSCRAGVDITLKTIVDKDLSTQRDVEIGGVPLSDDLQAILTDPEISVVVQLVGGVKVAREIMLQVIAAGKHVVTANKALLATHGSELFKKACEAGVSISFEASVGGGIPIIAATRDSFIANKIESVFGIVNGTANFVLTRMARNQSSFDHVVAEAQKKGYAEADPTLDLEGGDSAHKLAVLARIAFGLDINYNDIYVEGITGITLNDIRNAQDLGYKIKLLAIGKEHDDTVELRVHPTLLPLDHPLASVDGVFNAICVNGDAVGKTMLYGRGAGQMPTASAVVSDVIEVATGRAQIAFQRLKLVNNRDVRVQKIDEVETRYYVRHQVVDRPGVLAQITGIFGQHQISIASVIQQEGDEGGWVPLVMMTHEANDGNMQRALKEIDELDVVKGRSLLIRVES